MSRHEVDASGPGENRTRKEPGLSADKQGDSPLPGGRQAFDDRPPSEVSGSAAWQDPFSPVNPPRKQTTDSFDPPTSPAKEQS
jgi:hypothetical protein